MGREVRRVQEGWNHPRYSKGNYKPLHDGYYESDADEFVEIVNSKSLQEAVDHMPCPDKNDYMPSWEQEPTHLMMYEISSIGTPISPAFKTPEELATWLHATNAQALAFDTATYDQWLTLINEGLRDD